MSRSSPDGGESSGVGATIGKSWVALLLCIASVLSPDVLVQQGQELPNSPRPPLALALSEEQVRANTAGWDRKVNLVFVACFEGKSLCLGARATAARNMHMMIDDGQAGWLHLLLLLLNYVLKEA